MLAARPQIEPRRVPGADSVVVSEIYLSLQGESSHQGLLCSFVRLDGVSPALPVVRLGVRLPGRDADGHRRGGGAGAGARLPAGRGDRRRAAAPAGRLSHDGGAARGGVDGAARDLGSDRRPAGAAGGAQDRRREVPWLWRGGPERLAGAGEPDRARRAEVRAGLARGLRVGEGVHPRAGGWTAGRRGSCSPRCTGSSPRPRSRSGSSPTGCRCGSSCSSTRCSGRRTRAGSERRRSRLGSSAISGPGGLRADRLAPEGTRMARAVTGRPRTWLASVRSAAGCRATDPRATSPEARPGERLQRSRCYSNFTYSRCDPHARKPLIRRANFTDRVPRML